MEEWSVSRSRRWHDWVCNSQKTLFCPQLGSNVPLSKVWMESLIFAVDRVSELGDRRRKRPMIDVSICSHSSCRLKSPLALSGKKLLSTKVTHGARRVKLTVSQCVKNIVHDRQHNTHILIFVEHCELASFLSPWLASSSLLQFMFSGFP